MNKQEYNNVIKSTVERQTNSKDALNATREILSNMGVVLPQGDIQTVSKALSTDDYMGWRKCTIKEAQDYVNDGVAVVAVNDDQVAVVVSDEQQSKSFMNTASVMPLTEDISAFAISDTTFYANRAGTTAITTKESVSVEYRTQEDCVVVNFGNERKVWWCVGADMIFNDANKSALQYIQRSNKNFWVDKNGGEIREYTMPELQLLFAIDPYGVAHYIKRFAEHGANSLETQLSLKDWFFLNLFERSPKYYTRDVWSEKWHVTTVNESTNFSTVVSESECYFGMHAIWDNITMYNIIQVVLNILADIFDCDWYETSNIIATEQKVYATGVLVRSCGEDIVKALFMNDVSGVVEDALAKTPLSWAITAVKVYAALQDIADALTVNYNYCDKIVDYCANTHGFEVSLNLPANNNCNLSALSEEIQERLNN